jgi:hypothetical protein
LRWSITELEHEQALDHGKPCLVFCVQDKHPWSLEWVDFDEPARGRLQALQARQRSAAPFLPRAQPRQRHPAASARPIRIFCTSLVPS